MEQQHLSNEELKLLVGINNFDGFQLTNADSYNDAAVLKTITETGAMTLLRQCAIQTAVVGYRKYGVFIIDGDEMAVRLLYKKYNVKSDLDPLGPGDLSPHRLQRFFRNNIREYFEQNKQAYPYLWKKYSDCDDKFRTIAFQGGEYLCETKEEGLYLLHAYKAMDSKERTNIAEKIEKILLTRKVLCLEDLREF